MIYVKDLASLAAFYGDVLEVAPVVETRSATFVEFDTGGATLALHAIPAHTADQIEISSPPQAREEMPIKLMFEVADVAAERVRLEAMGATVIQRPWGTCDVTDPEGNIFQLYSKPTEK